MTDEGTTPEADRGGESTGGRPCPRCERPLYKRHCKYVCPQHGVVYDCSDTFWV
ncbi:HVO_2523 family zinc finger protein [Halosolutus gelatinilyticus]|uniref:HVO_2523 family zinc finger protein n=1 Tax=Halosolutus gelatinilyticus TaxID=2931975 RepID=UPI001FF13918|nr:HVO_2523 family zinc finger protein [Halosolutus gelatinilyticus]